MDIDEVVLVARGGSVDDGVLLDPSHGVAVALRCPLGLHQPIMFEHSNHVLECISIIPYQRVLVRQ